MERAETTEDATLAVAIKRPEGTGRKQMTRILMAGRNTAFISAFAAFAKELEENNIRVTTVDHGRRALSIMTSQPFDVLIADEEVGGMTGLQLIEQVVSKNPMVNCVAVSTLSPEDFHEASEGLGVMMQLPAEPDRKEAEKMLLKLKKIKNLMKEMG